MVDLKPNLERYVPYLFDLIEGQNISWKNLNKNFQANYETREKEFKRNNGYLRVEMTFYDLISNVLNDKPDAISFFIYINTIFKSLKQNLSKKERMMVGTIIRNMLFCFNLDYMHSLGELFVLNKLILSKNYRLEKVEEQMQNGKRVDFKLFCYSLNKIQLVEIVNIRLDEKKIDNHVAIKKYLLSKIWTKIKDQTKDFKSDFDFILVPVLWGSAKELNKISEFYTAGEGVYIHGVAEPVSYCCWHDDTISDPVYRFTEVSILFKEPIS